MESTSGDIAAVRSSNGGGSQSALLFNDGKQVEEHGTPTQGSRAGSRQSSSLNLGPEPTLARGMEGSKASSRPASAIGSRPTAAASTHSRPQSPSRQSEASFRNENNHTTSASQEPPAPPLMPSDSVDFSKSMRSVTIDVQGGSGKMPQHLVDKQKKLQELQRAASGPASGRVANSYASASARVDASNLGSVDKRTGLELPSPLQLFRTYDLDTDGAISRVEFSNMLFELNGLDEVPINGDAEVFKKKRDKYSNEQFEKWDLNHDDMISIDEFYIFFYSDLCFKFPLQRTGVNPGADLFNIFVKYCSFGKNGRHEEMGSHQFSKLTRDCKLVNQTTLMLSVVDIIYFRSKAELGELEDFKKKHNEYITNKMLYPQFLYALLYIANKRQTGFQEVVSHILSNVSAKPNPSMADLVIFRSDGSDRQKEEYLERPRGLPRPPKEENDMTERMRMEASIAKEYGLPCAHKHVLQAGTSVECHDESHVHDHVADYDAHAGHEHGAESLPPTPSLNQKNGGTEKDSARGGGDNESLPDYTPVACSINLRKWGLKGAGNVSLPKSGPEAIDSPASLIVTRNLDFDTLLMALKKVFETYNLWDHGVNKGAMDKIRFMKLMRDVRLVSEQEKSTSGLGSAMLEKLYIKVLPLAKSTLNFVQFVETLRHIAMLLRITLNEVTERIVIVQRPA